MRYTLLVVVALFVAGCYSAGGYSQAEGWQKIPGAGLTSAGRVELGGDVGYTYSHQVNDSTSTLTREFTLDHIIGYCATDNIEIEFRPFLLNSKEIQRDRVPPISPTTRTWMTGGGGGFAFTYNIPSEGTTVPFLSLGYGGVDLRGHVRWGMGSFSVADTVPVVMGILGVKLFSGENGCARIGLTFTKWYYDKDSFGGPEEEWGLTLGYSIWF